MGNFTGLLEANLTETHPVSTVIFQPSGTIRPHGELLIKSWKHLHGFMGAAPVTMSDGAALHDLAVCLAYGQRTAAPVVPAVTPTAPALPARALSSRFTQRIGLRVPHD